MAVVVVETAATTVLSRQTANIDFWRLRLRIWGAQGQGLGLEFLNLTGGFKGIGVSKRSWF